MNSAATITVKQTNPPAEGKKQGKVRTDSGELYGVWPKMMGLLRPGATYEVEFTESTFGDGRKWRTISKVRHIERAASAPASQNDNRRAEAHSPVDPEFEFVARALSASIQACAVEYTQAGLTETVRMLRNVYREGMR